MVTFAEHCFVHLKVPPNPDLVCCFDGLQQAVPGLRIGSQPDWQKANSVPGILYPGQDRFFWEPMPLPETCTVGPFAHSTKEWQLMFHLCRPIERDVLNVRLYLKRHMKSLTGENWSYNLWWFDRAPLLSEKALKEPNIPINLMECICPLRMTTFVHAHKPEFSFDLKLMAGPAANVFYVRKNDKDVMTQLAVEDSDGTIVLQREGSIRDLSQRCDLEACQKLAVPRTIKSNASGLVIKAKIDTGPWSGLVCMQETHLLL